MSPYGGRIIPKNGAHRQREEYPLFCAFWRAGFMAAGLIECGMLWGAFCLIVKGVAPIRELMMP